MKLEYFIARRITDPAAADVRSVMVRIGVATCAVSMAVMIVALAVIDGFRTEIAGRIIGMTAAVQIVPARGGSPLGANPLRRDPLVEQALAATDGELALYPFALQGGIIRSDEAVEGVVLKGVGRTYDGAFLGGLLVRGRLPEWRSAERRKEVLLSERLALRLKLDTGARMEMLFWHAGTAPRRDRFRITGIYRTGMAELDDHLVVGDLRDVQRLAGWASDEVSGYEVGVGRAADADLLAARLNGVLAQREPRERLVALGPQSRFPQIFDWLKAHRVNGAVVIGIMLVVAAMNMGAAVLVLLLERTRMIGVLKALGMSDGRIGRIFLWRSFFLLSRGLLWGNLAGLALCAVQALFHLVRLDPEGYLLSEVPVAFGWGWWAALNLGALGLLLLVVALPVRLIARVRPEKTIRYE